MLNGKRIGFALTGSHCTLVKVIPEIKKLIQKGAEVYPIISFSIREVDTRFGTAKYWKDLLEKITLHSPISNIVEAEPIGPEDMFDVLVIAPCTGNTLAKLVWGMTDSAVLMAAKAQLRNEKPVVVAFSTNDGLGMNAKNIGLLLNMKNIYVVPFGQDEPFKKSRSIVAHFPALPETISAALEGRQIQPLLYTGSHSNFANEK